MILTGFTSLTILITFTLLSLLQVETTFRNINTVYCSDEINWDTQHGTAGHATRSDQVHGV